MPAPHRARNGQTDVMGPPVFRPAVVCGRSAGPSGLHKTAIDNRPLRRAGGARSAFRLSRASRRGSDTRSRERCRRDEKGTPRSRTAAVRQRRAHVRNPMFSECHRAGGEVERLRQAEKGRHTGRGRHRQAGKERHAGSRGRQGRRGSSVPESYRIALELRMEPFAAACSFLEASPPERIFQKRSVSSAAAVTTVVPSGD